MFYLKTQEFTAAFTNNDFWDNYVKFICISTQDKTNKSVYYVERNIPISFVYI